MLGTEAGGEKTHWGKEQEDGQMVDYYLSLL